MGEVKLSMYRWCPNHDRKEDWLYYSSFLFLFMVLCLFIAHSEHYANKLMKKYSKILKLLQSEKFNS